VALAALLLALAGALPAAEPARPWQEALVSVRDLSATARFFREVAGYEIVHSGAEDPRLMAHWGLEAAAGARSLVFGRAGAPDGYVRLVEFAGVESIPIRATARAWDTGGFFSLMMRVRDIEARFDEALALGWSAESAPVRFEFEGLTIRNVVLKGPDGLNVALYERVAPPLAGWPPFERLSRPFNAMQMVRDKDAAVAFYRDVLGFETFWEGDYLDPAPAMNNFGIPRNYVTRIPRRTGILYPVPGETGRVEVMELAGFEGRDLAARAKPPNLGILAVRYPVPDLDARLAAIRAADWPIAYPPSRVTLAPWGEVRIAGVRSPDGALVAFFERIGAH